MLKIKSYQNTKKKPLQVSPLKPLTKNHETQCSFPELINRCQSENVGKDTKDSESKKKQNRVFRILRRKNYNRFSNIFQSQNPCKENLNGNDNDNEDDGGNEDVAERSIYENVNVINVGLQEDKLCRVLQFIAMGKNGKLFDKRAIQAQFITFWKVSPTQNPQQQSRQQIKVSMQTLYKHYLESNSQELKKSIMKGNINKIIIKPFLSMFKKIKMEVPVIHVKYYQTKSQKSDIVRILEIYKPKVILNLEIKKIQEKGLEIYQQLYRKYESLPFYQNQHSQPQSQSQPQPQPQHSQNQTQIPKNKSQQSAAGTAKRLSCQEHPHPENRPPTQTSNKNGTETPNQNTQMKTWRQIDHPTLDDAREQILKVGFTQNNIKQDPEGSEGPEGTKQNSCFKFEDKFKKQIEKLSKGLNDIISL